MIADHDAMPYDADVLKAVMDQHGITVLALAHRSGFDDKTIYRYLIGERTCPSMVLRAAYELTGDFRLVTLVLGARPLILDMRGEACKSGEPSTPTPTRTPPPLPPISELMPTAVRSVKNVADSLDYIAKIVSDGVIDASDAVAKDKFNEHASAAINDLSRLMAAMQPTKMEAAK